MATGDRDYNIAKETTSQEILSAVGSGVGIKKVQRGVADCDTPSVGFVDVTITEVNTDKTFVNVCPWLFYSSSNDSTNVSDLEYPMNDNVCCGVLTSSTNLRLYYSSKLTYHTQGKIVWELIEFN